MNTQPAQPIPDKGQQPDSGRATISINAAQLARIAELLDILDGFLRHADGVADRLADYRLFRKWSAGEGGGYPRSEAVSVS